MHLCCQQLPGEEMRVLVFHPLSGNIFASFTLRKTERILIPILPPQLHLINRCPRISLLNDSLFFASTVTQVMLTQRKRRYC